MLWRIYTYIVYVTNKVENVVHSQSKKMYRYLDTFVIKFLLRP